MWYINSEQIQDGRNCMHTKRIIKFGGSSLADADRFSEAVQIIANRQELKPLVVVSAVGSTGREPKVTDLLKKAGESLLSGGEAAEEISIITGRHRAILKKSELPEDLLEGEFRILHRLCDQIGKGGHSSREEALDAVMGFGEILSARIMAEMLSKAGLKYSTADPGDLGFITDENFQNADILEESLEKIALKVIASRHLLVIPGYIGVTADGRKTTLGRGGSDYTAAILGAALKRDVEIWTDVDGIYRIPPAHLPEAFKAAGHPETIPELSYEEAFQMAAYGSRVLYEKALLAVHQAVKKGKHIQLIIKNTFNPDHPGTIVSSQRQEEGFPRGITLLDGTQLLTLYTENPEEAGAFKKDLQEVEGLTTALSSETFGRISFVFENYLPELSRIEAKYRGHLSRDQVLIKIVGDGLGDNPRILSKIHGALQDAENPDKYEMTLVHKSPQILTDNTFEFLVKKRGLSDIVLSLYKALFMENTITVGMLGMGTVGSGVLHYSRTMYSPEKGGFKLRFPAAMVRDPSRRRKVEYDGRLTTKIEDILDDPTVDIVLEVMGGIEPARTCILEAFRKGKHVVTANKALLAECGPEIFAEADRHGRNLGFEASVCGEIPIIEDFLSYPGLADIQGIEGIVNGTSNYILTRFMEGMSFEQALGLAQEKGFAEADPFMDVSGTDASQKLSIMASILFNQFIEYKKIPRQGIEGLLPIDRSAFEKWGVMVKPLAMAKILKDDLYLRVSPALVPLTHPLASVRDENNALAMYMKGRAEPITKIGKGAGAIPTARSIVRDILSVSRKSRAYMVDLPGFFRTRPGSGIQMADDFSSRWYLRFTVSDDTGVFGKIASMLGDFRLSIRHVLQEEEPEEKSAHILLELKEARLKDIERAMEVIRRLPFVKTHYTCMML
jgi:homoserine dehydrogenase